MTPDYVKYEDGPDTEGTKGTSDEEQYQQHIYDWVPMQHGAYLPMKQFAQNPMPKCIVVDCKKKSPTRDNPHWGGLCGMHFVWMFHIKKGRVDCGCGNCKAARRYNLPLSNIPEELSFNFGENKLKDNRHSEKD